MSNLLLQWSFVDHRLPTVDSDPLIRPPPPSPFHPSHTFSTISHVRAFNESTLEPNNGLSQVHNTKGNKINNLRSELSLSLSPLSAMLSLQSSISRNNDVL